MYNTKNKLQATDFTPAESNLAKDSDSKITAKCYCPDPGRTTPERLLPRALYIHFYVSNLTVKYENSVYFVWY